MPTPIWPSSCCPLRMRGWGICGVRLLPLVNNVEINLGRLKTLHIPLE